jgi:L-cystine uptake protein TcyP (sodium:dicarboxylate symporter family)
MNKVRSEKYKKSNMKEQHFGNHVRYVPLFHFVTLPLILLVIIASVLNLLHNWSDPHLHFVSAIIFLLALIAGLLSWFVRSFALRAQNRAIRAEEGLRYFILTGKRMDSRLRLSQVIALRFAPDEEFVSLAHRAVEEKLDVKAIKQAITHWRKDGHRV